ncbi:TauD/TfdA family dioxygenase [Rhizobium lusitanum]|uniref:TauD/TfdA family dioxygenase n=1 Tax=Rhizobium lusitanum TaxID=293958 RepID=UPI002573E206|nr:TauD/TfdA family dioxygenase [Rhizobium lusitanum]
MAEIKFANYFFIVKNIERFRVPVHGRPFLATSDHPLVPKDIPDIGSRILTVAPMETDGFLDDPDNLEKCRCMIDDQLAVNRGVLLRNFALRDRSEFEAFIRALGYGTFSYKGGIAIREQENRVSMNASDEDSRITLAPHNEMAYLANYPRKIFFYCDTQAERGGEVPINDIRETLPLIPSDIREKFERLGVRYYRMLPRRSQSGQTGWTETFGTSDCVEVEAYMRQNGYDFEWIDDDRLKYSYQRPAILRHPETGEQLWFNQITELNSSYWRNHPQFAGDLPEDAYPATTSYGDGSPIDPDTIGLLRAALWRSSYAVRMQPQDLLVLDNQIMQHGRFAYEGARRHYVSMAA